MTYYTEEQAMKKYCLFQSGCCRASSCMGWQWEQVVDKVIPKPFPYPTKYIYKNSERGYCGATRSN